MICRRCCIVAVVVVAVSLAVVSVCLLLLLLSRLLFVLTHPKNNARWKHKVIAKATGCGRPSHLSQSRASKPSLKDNSRKPFLLDFQEQERMQRLYFYNSVLSISKRLTTYSLGMVSRITIYFCLPHRVWVNR